MNGPDDGETNAMSGGDDDVSSLSVDRPRPSSGSTADEPSVATLLGRDFAGSLLAVALVGMFLFAASGVWPPMVAIESQSMTPHLNVGDLVFVMEEDRFAADAQVEDTGVVSAHRGSEVGYASLGGPGDVVVYEPDGDEDTTPIIHRAMFWVDNGENWYDRADGEYLGRAEDCGDLRYCPAPNAGFITKGDANPRYDQVGSGIFSRPVKPEWVVGRAEASVPWLGCLRLASQSGGTGCTLVIAPAVGASTVGPGPTGAPSAVRVEKPSASSAEGVFEPPANATTPPVPGEPQERAVVASRTSVTLPN